jgi:hypothetical protein
MSKPVCSDGFHPPATGYDAWAAVMWPALERAARRFDVPLTKTGS